MGELLLGCSGWSYADPPEKGGWTGAFYPDSKTRRLSGLDIPVPNKK